MAKKTSKPAKKGKKLTVDDLKKVGGGKEDRLDPARKLADPMVKQNKRA